VRMNTIFYSFICLALAFKVQAESVLCRSKEKDGSFLVLLSSDADAPDSFTKVPKRFYVKKESTVKVLSGYSAFWATPFTFNKKNETYTNTELGRDKELGAHIVYTSKKWGTLCKPPEDQYNCEFPRVYGIFLNTSNKTDLLEKFGLNDFVLGSYFSWGRKDSTTTPFYKNESDGSFYFEKPGNPILTFNSEMVDEMCRRMVKVDDL